MVALCTGCNKKTDSPAPAPKPGPGPRTESTAGAAAASSPGQAVFQSNCSRCHTTTGQAQTDRPKGKMQGPDLAHVAADSSHTREWLIAFINDPASQKPGARMPKFNGKIGNDDLEKIADYLLTLK
jgi:cytochrome c oxidase subunit 2